MTLYGYALSDSSPWNLPAIPRNTQLNTPEIISNIPKIIWISSVSPKLPPHMYDFIQRNSKWKVNIMNDEMQHLFLKQHFSNTSILWAFEFISCGAAKSDIFRYAVLWKYGGIYIDDDSDIQVPLDSIVLEKDQFIIAPEQNQRKIDFCYTSKYLEQYGGTKLLELSRPFNESRVTIQWAFFSRPQHPFLTSILEHIVETLRYEYLGKSILNALEQKWRIVLCITGPDAFTFAITKKIAEFKSKNQLISNLYRASNIDFQEYGGIFVRKNIQKGTHWKHQNDCIYLGQPKGSYPKNSEGFSLTNYSLVIFYYSLILLLVWYICFRFYRSLYARYYILTAQKL